jgi:hypothetical protein
MHGIVHAHDIIFERRPSRGYHALDTHVLPDFLDNGRRLQCELSRGYEDENLDVRLSGIGLLQAGNNISGSFACPILCSGQDCSQEVSAFPR